jgi:enamine deaminase RidA (YjgF/YER057c/UK114 family)
MFGKDGTKMKLERFRKFNTRDVYPGGKLDNDLCMTVKAGGRIFMRGQTGLDLNQNMVDPNNVVAQAEQAMENVKVLLEEAGSSIDHVCKVTTYLTDPAYRTEVYNVVGNALRGNPTVATGLIVKGLAMPQMKVELDIEAAIPNAGGHKKFRLLNTGQWFGQTSINRDSCMVINTGDEVYLRGQTGCELDGSKMYGHGFTPAAAAAQAEQSMKNAIELLEEAGSSLADVCKTRIYIYDRAYREPVYQALGKYFGVTYPCSTGLIMRGFARPEILFEIDMAVTLSKGMPHQRFHKFHTNDVYKDGQQLGSRFCKAVRAGDRVYLRGQTGSDLDGNFVGEGDPAAQADQAMKNIKALLEEAGSKLEDICKLGVYIQHRAHREAIYNVIGRHLKGVHPCSTGLIVDGFARPNILVEIDADAVIQD